MLEIFFKLLLSCWEILLLLVVVIGRLQWLFERMASSDDIFLSLFLTISRRELGLMEDKYSSCNLQCHKKALP